MKQKVASTLRRSLGEHSQPSPACGRLPYCSSPAAAVFVEGKRSPRKQALVPVICLYQKGSLAAEMQATLIKQSNFFFFYFLCSSKFKLGEGFGIYDGANTGLAFSFARLELKLPRAKVLVGNGQGKLRTQ